mmetsp:Transcript_30942/g.73776  ORF Transcript_30942/g.73776 Transcript_30942/m.73776 type:complete len:201 (+) Transcript_30942:441-1043(+)
MQAHPHGGGLYRVPRHRHGARRPHRGWVLQEGDERHPAQGAASDHVIQVQHRARRGRRWSRRFLQVLLASVQLRGCGQRAPEGQEPALGHGGLPVPDPLGVCGHARGRGLRGCLLLRLWRNQRPRGGVGEEHHELQGLHGVGPREALRAEAGKGAPSRDHHERGRRAGLGDHRAGSCWADWGQIHDRAGRGRCRQLGEGR